MDQAPAAKSMGAESAPLLDRAKRHNDRAKHREYTLQQILSNGARHLQVQLETIPPYGARILFWSWYFVLFVAFVLQLGTWQWQCLNVCGPAAGCSLDQYSGWNSATCARPALTTNSSTAAASADPRDGYSVAWEGAFSEDFDPVLNRFVHFLLTMRRPQGVEGTVSYEVEFSLRLIDTTIPATGGHAELNNGTVKYVFQTNILFIGGRDRCEVVTLPTSTSSVSNSSRVVLTARRLPAELVNVTLGASVAAVYQEAQYTVATVAVRYTLMVLLIAHMIRSWYHNVTAVQGMDTTRGGRRPSSFEQKWVFVLQVGLLLYLNPLFAAGVYIVPEHPFFAFLEFRLPLYFVTLVVCFMFALISAAMAWSHRQELSPPMWAQALNVFLFVTVVSLDVAGASLDNYDWGMEQCPNFQCTPIGYATYAIIIVYVLICTVWMRYLHLNLGKKPYLESRPQQLTMRLFIFIFTTYAFYFVISSVVVVLVYKGVSSAIQYQGLLQIGIILVSFTFVNIMSFAFTYVLRTEGVPIHPSDSRWRKVRWPESWYHWVSLHGGNGYIFFREAEERRFMRIQSGAPAVEGDDVTAPHFRISPDGRNEGAAAGNAAVSSSDDDIDECAWEGEEAPATATEASRTGGGEDNDDDGKTLLDRATKAAFSRPAQILKRLEDGLVETAIYFHIFTAAKVPFFCLETCIDALNLAWEAYGVASSAGDAEVETGVVVRDLLPKWCCCGRTADDEEQSRQSAMPDADATGDSAVLLKEMSQSSTTAVAREISYNATPSARSRQNTIMSDNDGSTEPLIQPQVAGATAAPAKVPLNTAQYGYTTVTVFVGMDVQVVISMLDTSIPRHKDKEQCIAVAFRGTDNLSNAVQDAKIAMREWPAMKGEVSMITDKTRVLQPRVHSGFLDIWNVLRSVVLNKVHELREAHPTARLLITGHSLGGAIATFAAYELQKECYVRDDSANRGSFMTRMSHAVFRHEEHSGEQLRHSLPIVYTFGMPRVGNSPFRDVFNKRVPQFFRVVNESDAVSHFSLFGGTHVGVEVDIDRYGNYIIRPMFIERMFRPTKGRGSSIAHHSMTGYATSLNAIAKSGTGVCPSLCLEPYVDVVMVLPPAPATPSAAADSSAPAPGAASHMPPPALPTTEE